MINSFFKSYWFNLIMTLGFWIFGLLIQWEFASNKMYSNSERIFNFIFFSVFTLISGYLVITSLLGVIKTWQN